MAVVGKHAEQPRAFVLRQAGYGHVAKRPARQKAQLDGARRETVLHEVLTDRRAAPLRFAPRPEMDHGGQRYDECDYR
jgi:hypothetical protein